MKKLLIIAILLIVSLGTYSQDLRLRAFSSTYSYADKNGAFNDLETNEHKTNILIAIGKNTLTVYAKSQTTYSIVAKDEIKYDSIGAYSTISLLDDEGIQCIGKVYVPEKTDTYHLIIQYSNVMFVYNCKEE